MGGALVAFVRHGKAEADSRTGLDEDRRLRGKGERQASHVGAWLAGGCGGALDVGGGVRVGAVVSSRAVRARETAELIASACGVEVGFDDRLFLGASAAGVFGVAAEVSRGFAAGGVVVLVGHNPTMGRVVGMAGGGVGGWEAAVRTGEAHVFRFAGAVEAGGGALVGRTRLES